MSCAEAREKARDLLKQITNGIDIFAAEQERRDRDEVTLRAVAKDFLGTKKKELKPNSLRMLTSYLEGPYLKPLLASPIDRITRKDISARVRKVEDESGASTAGALRSAVSALFVYAMKMGLVEHNPVINSHEPARGKPRERVLVDVNKKHRDTGDAELAAVWRALGDDEYSMVVKLIILTGCRREEIGGMAWSEFSDDGSTWMLPASRSKNGAPHMLLVTPLMRSIIDAVPVRLGRDNLFGLKRGGGFTQWAVYKKALDARLTLPEWHLHDLRRSAATGMANLGAKPHVVEAVLNHQSGSRAGVAGTYNLSSYWDEVCEAMQMWSDHVEKITGSGPTKVVRIREARKAS